MFVMKNTTVCTLALILFFPLLSVAHDGGFLGIRAYQLSDAKVAALDLPAENGFYITEVYQNSEAERIGLEVFDYIYSLDGENFEDHMDLGDMLDGFNPGDEITLEVSRLGIPLEISAVLGKREDATRLRRGDAEDPFLGIYYNHYRQEQGPWDGAVPVLVQECSTAQLIGLQDEDRIYQIDDYPTVDWHDLGAAIDARTVGDPITVYFYRDGQMMVAEGPIRSEETSGEEPCLIEQPSLLEMPEDPVAAAPAQVLPSFVEELVEPERQADNPAEINRNTANLDLLVFPNPNNGQFTIMLMLPEDGVVELRVIDGRGSVVRQMQMQRDAGEYIQRVDLSGFAPGAYFVQLRQNQVQAQERIIISQ
jgi:hypothetical protein